MNTGAAATITAAAISFAGLVYQQTRHWRETRRDKLRDAYAEWMSAVARVRRVEERFLIRSILAYDALRIRAAAGDPLAMQGGLVLSDEDRRTLNTIEHEIEANNLELDFTFHKVCLLDRDWRRIKAAEAVRDMETIQIHLGERPSEETFNERWTAKSKAMGELADLINRTLALEGTFSFAWDSAERSLDERQDALHARMNTNRRGRPKSQG